MSSHRRSRKKFDGVPPMPTPTSARAGAGRSAWKVWRHLMWTSTVASACTTTRVQTAPLPDTLPSSQRGEIRLSLKSGQQITMYDARVVQDSIIGFSSRDVGASTQRIAVARADVQTVATKRVSVGKTILAVIGGAFATLSLLLLVACASLSSA